MNGGRAGQLHPWNTGGDIIPERVIPPGDAGAAAAYIAQEGARSPRSASKRDRRLRHPRNGAASTGMSWWRSAIRLHGAVAFAIAGEGRCFRPPISRYRRRCQPAERDTVPLRENPLHKSEDKPKPPANRRLLLWKADHAPVRRIARTGRDHSTVIGGYGAASKRLQFCP